jgi:hypothetical protein
MKKLGITVVGLIVFAFCGVLRADLIAHYELEEASLSDLGSGTYGNVVDSTGEQANGRYWAVAGQLAYMNASLVNQTGPETNGDDRAYAFESNTNWRVSTYEKDLLPADDSDFTVLVSFKTSSSAVTMQGHLFSNNGAQAGRGNLYVQGSSLFPVHQEAGIRNWPATK